MPSVTYISPDGTETTLEGRDGDSVMDLAVKNGVKGIVAECGGACACETCHVYVDEAFSDEVGEAGDDDVTSVPVQTKAAATSATTPTATKSATATATPTPTAAKTAAAATPTATPTPTPTKTASTVATSVAKTGSAINYKYGTIQLEVVKSGSKITSINLIQASTKGREWASVPSMLVTAAISAQGSGFGNISGATFSTQAFKSALESALAKF